MQSLWQQVTAHLDWHVDLADVAIKLLIFVALYIVARILIRVLIRTTHRILHSRAVRMDTRKRDTLLSLTDNITRYTIYFIYVLTILPMMNIHVEAFLAGAGIAGLAIGFGAQSLIKDVLTGLFILFEDQYGVGDVVQINNFTGTVKAIGLRLTRIQAWTGEMEVIPNGQITQVRNFSRNNSIAVVDVGFSYETSLDKAMNILRNVMEQVRTQSEDVVGDVSIMGVQDLGQSQVVIRVTAECNPSTSGSVQRLIRQRVKEAFEQEGLAPPIPQTDVRVHPWNPNVQ